ncbi:AsnC family transcriptional regulator [candidate division MSBL1 archaeon SCGC-AAA261D19]|uniref:AsnC family transcriptional regulator n=1 Tax=candidate division MSBL1 archaeon SCGC-AAA261D19 TaxID=1698273 RepID=A0A133V8N2_9EURY|nr:AsnC family transcriptional regulator [candidate division MSBL1 archaeon SCGC-AAA261D19]
MDETDMEIVRMLEENGRIPFREIAERLDVSEGTVYNRVKRLQEENVIKGFSIRSDPMKLGRDLVAIIGLRVYGGHLVEVEKEVAEHPGVRAVYDVTGDHDAILIIRFETRAELNDFVKKLLSHKYVERTSTYVVLNVVKEDMRTLT